ncbi:putative integral membrane protein with CBS regulatory domain [Candidatus Competibacter denitrificans Run_A_D11]|uniref:Magnesium and cobalt efflux protein CorC n=1 Tax=Candidatus Competibacter denitrificans Run_A_D11 TaxID=1400863 RepID=W6M144_9GAMM|nr:transporter associated domain-containing protein [Candidatus Competibacter denitrificans]CDI01056.1 putative integral membrane protein with CBS regulatory domain [Candidatus Competibacter denitrificans Run_A_D11]HRC68985.1 transporter associated domain-containing protein [Candidatus Competibacter denitrificans]
MSEERSESSHKPSWLERLGLTLTGEPKDRADLIDLLRDAQQRALLDPEALKMMEGVMRVSETQVRDVMIPRAQMVVLESDWSFERLIAEIVESGHSRFPVIDESKDNVIGILIVKDLLIHAFDRREDFDLRTLLRPVKFIPESKRLNILLNEFRSSRFHMAIVVDEYGGVAGVITIEDVLEEIVGEIDDEHDTTDGENTFIRRQGDVFIVKALTPVEDFNHYFQAELSDDKADTIGGLLVMELGRLPKSGEIVDLGPFHFRILRADNRRVHTLEMTPRDGKETPVSISTLAS